jgi:hypothetical protein
LRRGFPRVAVRAFFLIALTGAQRAAFLAAFARADLAVFAAALRA